MDTSPRTRPSHRPFSEAVLAARERGRVALVADIKALSPRDGDLLRGRRPAHLARELEAAGACALSVVTEAEAYGGSIELLRQVAAATELAVLRKDFFTTPAQVEESARAGARAVLLVLASLGQELAAELHAAARSQGLEAVVEVHTRAELDRALALEPTCVGINNRSILELERDAGDVATTEALAPRVPPGIVVLSESSIAQPDHVRRALAAGAHGVLVGTALLAAPDPGAAVARLTGAQGEAP